MASNNAYGVTGFGGYIPRLRLERTAIAAAHKWMAPSLRSAAKGQRAFCSWDEDSITMAVEAGRDVLNGQSTADICRMNSASTTTPFADMLNASVVAGALELPHGMRALAIGQSQQAGTSALLVAMADATAPALVMVSDRPRGKPANTQEIGFGAGAGAFTLGSDGVIASLLGHASSTASFVNHFRSSDNKYDYFWEDRWIRDEGHMKIVPRTVKAALTNAGATATDIKHFVMPTPFRGNASALAKKLGLPAGCEADTLDENCGYSGAAAAIVATPEIARALDKRDMVTIKAVQLATSSGVESGTDQWDGSHVRTTRVAAKRAYEETGITNPRKELSLMKVHDCFSITELVAMEDLFVSADVRSTHDILNGFFDREGQGVPCQVDGGLKYFGHPIGATGLPIAYEIYTQLLGQADKRQLEAPGVGLLHNLGGVPALGVAAVAILGLHS